MFSNFPGDLSKPLYSHVNPFQPSVAFHLLCKKNDWCLYEINTGLKLVKSFVEIRLSKCFQAFSKKCINDRKNWLNAGMEERRLRKEAGLPEIYLYGSQTSSVTYGDFINKELILFSNMDNERSIPCLIDGKFLFVKS